MRIRTVAWVALAPLLLGGGAGRPHSDRYPATRGQAVVELVNAERAKEGLAPYRVSLRLHEAALGHARDLASGPESGHVDGGGSDPSMRADRVGYVSKDASRYVTYWVMVFGARRVADDRWVPCNP